MPDRIILIDKPYKWTSFDVVKKLRKPLLEEKNRELSGSERVKKFKVGHAGTLDPLATGLLVICTGKLTKKISEIQEGEKEYTGTITLGATTASYDLETVPENFKPFDLVVMEQLISLAKEFCGNIQQTPPIHSAKKIDGRRAYELARKGEEVTMKSSMVIIKDFEIVSFSPPEVEFRIVCSKGTYIRSIASDFGQKLGTGAYLSSLCRTRIGDYLNDNALTVQEFLNQISDNKHIRAD